MSGRGGRRNGGVRGASPSVRGRGAPVRGGESDASFSPMSAYLRPAPVGQFRRSSSDLALTRGVLTPLQYNVPTLKNRYELPFHGRGALSDKRPGGLRHAKTPAELLSVGVHFCFPFPKITLFANFHCFFVLIVFI